MNRFTKIVLVLLFAGLCVSSVPATDVTEWMRDRLVKAEYLADQRLALITSMTTVIQNHIHATDDSALMEKMNGLGFKFTLKPQPATSTMK